MTRSSSTQRRILDLPGRPDGGLGETGPSVSPNRTSNTRHELLATLHRLVEALTDLDDSAVAPPREPESDLPLLLDATEAGRLMSISRVKVLDLTGRGELPSIRVGRSVRIPRDLLVAWIERHADGGLMTAPPRLPNWAHVDRSNEL